jgi:ribosomal protein L19
MGDQRTVLRNADHGAKVVGQDIMEDSSTQKHRLGARLVLGDRVFRYTKNGSVALAAGKHVQSVITTNDFVPHANYTAGTIKVSTSSTTISTADQFAEGYLVLREGGGVGETYKIKGNDVGVGGVNKFTLYEPLVSDWVITTTSGCAVTNRYRNVVVGATATYASDPVGVPIIAVTANYYFWAQTWGPCGCLIGALTLGGDTLSQMVLSNDTTVAGALYPQIIVSAGSGVQNSTAVNVPIATSYLIRSNSALTAKYYIVNLKLDP